MCAYRIPSTPCTLQGNTKSKKRFKQNSGVLSYQFLPGNGTQTARRKVPPQKLFCIFFEHLEGRQEELVQIRRSCTKDFAIKCQVWTSSSFSSKDSAAWGVWSQFQLALVALPRWLQTFQTCSLGMRGTCCLMLHSYCGLYIYTWYTCIYTYMSINSAPGKTWCNIQYHTWAQHATSYYNMITSLYSKMLSRSLNSDTTDRSNMVTHRNRL